MHLDRQSCERATDARDPRFDGVFFVGVSTTGIYCRPICPARRTLSKNRRFFSTAAAAERAGFRPCLRCRPELAPGRARVDAVPVLAEAAARRIAAGALNEQGLEALARELGVSGRQLRRAMRHELGVSPIELAQTQRLLLAKQLITETQLSMTQVAFASGFRSVRRFNALFRAQYRMNPQSVRYNRRHRASAPHGDAPRDGTLCLTLGYRPPLAWQALLSFLGARGTPGVEHVTPASYARTVDLDGHTGVMRATCVGSSTPGDAGVVRLEVSAALSPRLMSLRARVRHLLDLDAEPGKIELHLNTSGFGRIERERRGLRVPGAFDGFELALRAILGQQVSVKGATTLMGRLAKAFGSPLTTPFPELTTLAPTAARIASARVEAIRDIGLPIARAATLHRIAVAVATGALRIDPDADVRLLVTQLTDLSGIGPWTAEYIAMRAAHWPDAFPASDLVLRRAAGNLSTAALIRAAEPWRPWRSYAAMHLWANAHNR